MSRGKRFESARRLSYSTYLCRITASRRTPEDDPGAF
jgi:hypothetical protein